VADKFVTLMIISQPAAKVSTLRFKRRTLGIVGVFLVGFVAFSVFLTAGYAGGKVDEARLARLEDRNRILNEELDGLRTSLLRQQDQLAGHVVIEERLRLAANLEPIPEEVRMMGIGGSQGYLPDYTRVLSDEEKTRLTSVYGQIHQLLRQTHLQKESFGEIEEAIAANREKWACVPSIRPVDSGYVSSGFGRRPDPFTGKIAMHWGVDYCTWPGEPVHATADGIVVKSREEISFGRIVVIDHGNGYKTCYGHNQENLVKKGQRVKRGDVIALVGNSGRSTGPHLHYEVQLDGKAVNPLNFVLSADRMVD
jgi:murein DD-endopeptidase MepM/ murein hydrolase activator NlpD